MNKKEQRTIDIDVSKSIRKKIIVKHWISGQGISLLVSFGFSLWLIVLSAGPSKVNFAIHSTKKTEFGFI